ncbi:hypothetical protein HU830_01585 [Lactobacillus sp. DCY120]|uniref:Uncharacterized protein n=1 Tax=Bombilactobacillus apium TaxID=2675299 RepID=A0A850R5K8_9LACO|nr:hypothetical protein [Bombilactobacillus apium]NVY95892.1 hypothetical protein [Bombilactobacillus apium]
MAESKPAMQCLSGPIMLAIERIYGVKVPEEFLMVDPGFLNIQLNKENLTFDTNVNDIILNYIGRDTKVESFNNISLSKIT